jgi:hypothetical protein
MINVYKQESERIYLVFAVFFVLVEAFVFVALFLKNEQYTALFVILVLKMVSGLVTLIFVNDLRFKYIVDSFMVYFKNIPKVTENVSSKKLIFK